MIEELGYYDPIAKETDARAVLKAERIDYWLKVGAQPSDKVKVLIKKYGTDGTHLAQQQAAIERLSIKPTAPPPVPIPVKKKEQAASTEQAGLPLRPRPLRPRLRRPLRPKKAPPANRLPNQQLKRSPRQASNGQCGLMF